MDWSTHPHRIADTEALSRLYAAPGRAAIVKEVHHLHPHYRAFIAAAPFVVLATSGPDGLDVSPRGDPAGFVVIEDDRTLLLPDRPGNNRIDSLRNIVADPRVALLFLIPGVNECLRVNGQAAILADPALLARFPMHGRLPVSVLAVHVESVFFQCARAILRSGLWEPESRIDRSSLPSTGTILESLSGREIDAGRYDDALPGRLRDSLY